MYSLHLGFGFLTHADFLFGTSGVVEDSTTKDVSLLETHVEICSATPVIVVPSVVDLDVTKAIWLVLARVVFSDLSELS